MSLVSEVDALAARIADEIVAIRMHQIPLSIPLDPVTTGTGVAQFIALRACTFMGSRATSGVGKAPTGADIILDVNLNGTTMYSTQANRPKVTAGSTYGAFATPNTTAIAAGDLITIDVDQVGSTLPGGVVTIVLGMY